ncbi:MAG: GIY-YIG nuclease family protein [Phycisphaerae bacterium]|nr:GIY-YIG nuclease family protein [Phycisphaerae bacterium]
MKDVYVLTSQTSPGQTCVGLTRDLKRRLGEHNAGKCRHTPKHAPWRCMVALRFVWDSKADDFERYLKSGSGRAFLKRHFL